MTALRCSMCGISWPADPDFEECPSCGESTDIIGNVKQDMSDREAASMRKHFLFDRFYAEWDESHDPKRLETLTEQEEAIVARDCARIVSLDK